MYWSISPSRFLRSSVYGLFPVPSGSSLSWIPPSSLYWTQKSVSSISAAAANRSNAASPGVRPPLASAVRMLVNSPAPPMVPAPTARELPKKDRRLIKRLDRSTFSSEFCACGECWLFLNSFAVDALVVFILVELEAPASHATAEKLRGCYFCGPPKRASSSGARIFMATRKLYNRRSELCELAEDHRSSFAIAR